MGKVLLNHIRNILKVSKDGQVHIKSKSLNFLWLISCLMGQEHIKSK